MRREVPIKVAKPGQTYAKKKHEPNGPVPNHMSGDSASDDLLRKQLGL